MAAIDPTELKATIRRVFSSAEYPGDDHIAYGGEDHLEGQQVAEHFRGKQWSDIDLAFIRGYDEFADASACLSFMTDEAFRYYLPAFLLVTLEDFADAGLVAATTVSKLAPWRDESDEAMKSFVERRLSGFTPAQREAIGKFLEHMSDTHRDDLEGDELDRALSFWRP